jgi:saccharopine dehydrogenase-like NADP-dependent oxidoreductase
VKVVMVGGGGRVARGVALDFTKFDAEELEELILADREVHRAQEIADWANDPRVKAEYVDGRDEKQLSDLFGKSDVVIYGASPSGEALRVAQQAALSAGTSLIILACQGPEVLEEVTARNQDFEDAGLTCVTEFGASPGICNLLAKAIVDRVDAIDTLELSFAHANLYQSTMPMTMPFSALWEFSTNTAIYKDYEWQTLPPMSLLQETTYPDPVGVRKCFSIPHGEVFTLPVSFRGKGLRNVIYRAGFAPDFHEQATFLASIGLAGTEPIKVGDVEVIPSDVVDACYRNLPPEKNEIRSAGVLQAIGKGTQGKDRVKLTATMMSYPYHGLLGTVHRTSTPAAIAARMIVRGEMNRKGVFPPERGFDPDAVFRELARRELEVELTQSKFL